MDFVAIMPFTQQAIYSSFTMFIFLLNYFNTGDLLFKNKTQPGVAYESVAYKKEFNVVL